MTPVETIKYIDEGSKCQHSVFRSTLLLTFQEDPDCIMYSELSDILNDSDSNDYLFRLTVLHRYGLIDTQRYYDNYVIVSGGLSLYNNSDVPQMTSNNFSVLSRSTQYDIIVKRAREFIQLGGDTDTFRIDEE